MYQPKVNLRTGETEGFEALLRWRHPRKGTLYPRDFVPAAERTSVIDALTLHVAQLALQQLAAWQRSGLETKVAVNLAVSNLRDTTLPRRLQEASDRFEVNPRRMTLGITERAMMEDDEGSLAVLSALRTAGFRSSIDDFGTGQSSLTRSKRCQSMS